MKIDEGLKTFWNVVEHMRHAADRRQPIHQVEETIFRDLLVIGNWLLQAFLDMAGTGDVGPTLRVASDGGPIPKSGDAPKSTGVRYAKGRRPNNTGDWQLGKSLLWKCFWSRKSKWAEQGKGKRKRQRPNGPPHPRQPPSRTRRDGS